MGVAAVEGWVLTERDLVVLRFVGRGRFVDVPTVTDACFPSKAACRKRLRVLRLAGLVRSVQPENGGRPVWAVTDLGRAVLADRTGLELGRLSSGRAGSGGYSPGSSGHTMIAARLMAAWERAGVEGLLSEREIRAEDRPNAPAALRAAEPVVCVPMTGGSWHVPDMAVPVDGGWVAVEVERSAKPVAVYERLLRAYRYAGHVVQVVYYADGPLVEKRLAEAAVLAGLDRLRIVPLADAEGCPPVEVPVGV